MIKNPQLDAVGDVKSPALAPDAAGLRYAADQAMTLGADITPAFRMIGKLGTAVPGQTATNPAPPGSCLQTIWISFFFDGTGNNMDADVGTVKHSNVAKLYRVHLNDDKAEGVYKIYIPGVGTYFREVHDDGATPLGLGAGSGGDARLNWALEQFELKLKPHIARASTPSTRILEVNVSVFGFSRGAALSRAFVNRLLEHFGKSINTSSWQLKGVGCPLRVRFMGLFDTVASVGVPMSFNNISVIAAPFGPTAMIRARLGSIAYMNTRPEVLAFAEGAQPGADPAPGVADGHPSYGGELAIPTMVEEVRHFIAAHELRNSFPVDSITRIEDGKVIKPAHFYESVYPGVHSDVGGSYRPGEGGRNASPEEKLGLIPLRQMYEFAIQRQVPLLPESAWVIDNKDDFAISQQLIEQYQYYMRKIPGVAVLGPTINMHMHLYYAWRFRAIKLKAKGDRTEENALSSAGQQYAGESKKLKSSIEQLETKNNQALRKLHVAQQHRLNYIQNNYGNADLPALPEHEARVAEAAAEQARTRDDLLREQAKLDALPSTDGLAERIAAYDAQLLADARAIYDLYMKKDRFSEKPLANISDLRPHYKALMEAYTAEYIDNAGLSDQTIIDFFNNYVHDSLSGFAKDATLPSDPRVVYLGGDEKYRYALRSRTREEEGRAYARSDGIPAEQVTDTV